MHGDDRARSGARTSLSHSCSGRPSNKRRGSLRILVQGIDRSAPPATRGAGWLRGSRGSLSDFGPLRSHGIAVIANPASFHNGIDKSALPSLPSEGQDGSQNRAKASRIFGHPQSWHCRDWKSAILSQGIERSAPPSLPREGRDGSDDREKACGSLETPQSWHRCDCKSGIQPQGIDKSAPPSLPSEGRGGSKYREKACRI